jgi:hypothetical protein
MLFQSIVLGVCAEADFYSCISAMILSGMRNVPKGGQGSVKESALTLSLKDQGEVVKACQRCPERRVVLFSKGISKKRECSTIFRVKPGKSSRNPGIFSTEPGETASHLGSSIAIL